MFIHGLWMNGLDMTLLESRFKNAGFHTSRYRYPSIKHTVIDNAHALAEFLQTITTPRFHLVCHSLGGLLVRHCLHHHSFEKLGKVVMLGTPNQASIAASKLSSWPGGKFLLGKSLEAGLLGPVPEWNPEIPLGVVAGDLRFGMGLIIPGIPLPNDGTVTVAETRIEGMHDHIEIHASHFGLLLSSNVFMQAQHFIKQGCFRHE